MKTNSPQTIRCPLCSFEFEKQESPCAQGCPLGKFCKLVCCPNCRYEFPEEPATFAWLRRLFGRSRSRTPRQLTEAIPLPELEAGQTSELVCLNCAQSSRRNTLAVYGLVPGSRLVLQQKRPEVIVRIGETELALERSIAREILVKRV